MEEKKIEVKKVFENIKKKDKIFVDVRSPAEFESSHIEGSFNIPLDELKTHKELFEKINKEIILICRSGNRAGQACELLESSGIKNVKIMEGGIICWEQFNLPIIKGKNKWDIERQVRFVAGSLVLIGSLLALLINFKFVYLSLFVGAGLVFAAITNSCMMGQLLLKLPYNKNSKKEITKKDIEKILKN